MFLYKKKAFTLVELLVGILIVSMVLIAGFSALVSVIAGKARIIDSSEISKEAFFFTQKLFEEIKKGGLVDYEEYFNRKIVGNTTYESGHYLEETGFGNEGNFYYCSSLGGSSMGVGGCVNSNNNSNGTSGLSTNNYSGSKQRYGQYSFQFIDYNSNYDGDRGDEDGDGNIRGDDDDEYIGDGPEVFVSGDEVTELYLISGDKTKRTFFRWNVGIDPDRPIGSTCDTSDGGRNYTGTGCLGTIEFLKLYGEDFGLDHNPGAPADADGTQYDGVVDTWFINDDFVGGGTVAGSASYEWLPLFPNTINVSNFEVYVYPNKDLDNAWKDSSESTNIAPYVRLKIELTPSWKEKKKISGTKPVFELNTTISLTDLYSR